MDRRSFCKTAVVAGVAAGTAGCLGVLGSSGAEGTVLGPPERDLSEASFPSYGDEMPELTVPDPIRNEEVSTAQFEGERAVLWTSFYTNCPDGVCPALILRLRRGQAAAAEDGYGDQTAFLPTTFDPERDTAEALREYAGQQGVNLDAGNWHFLRPETYERAQEIHDEHFGLKIEKQPADDIENLQYRFPHYGLIIMDYTRRSKFLTTILVSNIIAFMIGAIVSPPDPFTQFYYYLPLVPVTVVVSYLLVYRGGFDYIKARI